MPQEELGPQEPEEPVGPQDDELPDRSALHAAIHEWWGALPEQFQHGRLSDYAGDLIEALLIRYKDRPLSALREEEPLIYEEYRARSAGREVEGAEKNPVQQKANEALKIAKSLQDLLNELAGMQGRQEIAQASGLQNLPDAINRLYSLADEWRAGQVTTIEPRYAGWDLDKLRSVKARPFIDPASRPIKIIRDPAEVKRQPTTGETCPHCENAPLDAEGIFDKAGPQGP